MLSFSGKIIDVHPPRATALGKSFFWAHRFSWPVYRIRDPFASGFRSIAIDPSATRYNWATIGRTVIPGWAHWKHGQKTEARWFAGLYLCFVIPSVLTLATVFGALLAGFALAVHTVSTATALVPRFASPRKRYSFTVLCGIALILVVYLPLGWALSWFATPFSVGYDMPPLESGDVVWSSSLSNVHRGDFVLYDMPRTDAYGHIFIWRAHVINSGLRISRVIATENDVVEWRSNQLWVDGEPTSEPRPNSMPEQSMTIPQGQLLINATDAVVGELRGGSGAELGAILVPIDRLRGRIYLRTWPIWQLQFF